MAWVVRFSNGIGFQFPVHRVYTTVYVYREIMITYIDPMITFEQLCQEMRQICRFSQEQVFTMKWVDEDG